jgi:hypothetical protein
VAFLTTHSPFHLFVRFSLTREQHHHWLWSLSGLSCHITLSFSHAFLAVVGAVVGADQWVRPAGLPEGHNGGVLERITEPAGGVKPHIMFVLFDDYGWANAG